MIHLSIYLPLCLSPSTYIPICQSTFLPVHLFICLSIYLYIYTSIAVSQYQYISLLVYQSICLYFCFSTFLPDYLINCLLKYDAFAFKFSIFWYNKMLSISYIILLIRIEYKIYWLCSIITWWSIEIIC